MYLEYELQSPPQVVSWIMFVLGIIGTVASLLTLKGRTRSILLAIGASVAVVGILFLIPGQYRGWLGVFLVGSILGGYLAAQSVKPAILVIPKRRTLSFDEEADETEEVWIAWHSGSARLAQGDLFDKPRTYRIILTHPESPTLGEIAKICNLQATKIAQDIRDLTEQARRKGAEIKWFNGPIQNSMTIGDPNKKDGWARVEFVIPFGSPSDRPSIRIEQRKSPEFFARIKACHEALWNRSSSA